MAPAPDVDAAGPTVTAAPAVAAAPAGAATVAATAAAQVIAAHCRRTPQLAAALGIQNTGSAQKSDADTPFASGDANKAGGDDVEVLSLTGGMCNDVWLARGPAAAIVVKYAEPYVRANPRVALDLARQAAEGAALRAARAAAPNAIPAVLHHDAPSRMLAVEFLPDRTSLLTALLEGHVFPHMPGELGRALGAISAATAGRVGLPGGGDGGAPAEMGADLSHALVANEGVAAAMEQVVLYDAFDPGFAANAWPAHLDARVADVRAKIAEEVEAIRALRKAPPAGESALLHTDLWGGNILCGSQPGMTAVIDWEFAALGPAAYDIGHAFAAFLLGALTVRAYAEHEAAGEAVGLYGEEDAPPPPPLSARAAQLSWLLTGLEIVWEAYVAGAGVAGGRGAAAAAAARLPDALGFAGVFVLRWSIGEFNAYNSGGLPPGCAARDGAVRGALAVSELLLTQRARIGSAAAAARALTDALRADAPDSPVWAAARGKAGTADADAEAAARELRRVALGARSSSGAVSKRSSSAVRAQWSGVLERAASTRGSA